MLNWFRKKDIPSNKVIDNFWIRKGKLGILYSIIELAEPVDNEDEQFMIVTRMEKTWSIKTYSYNWELILDWDNPVQFILSVNDAREHYKDYLDEGWVKKHLLPYDITELLKDNYLLRKYIVG